MNIIKPIYEFLVWDNCSNNCKFCFQRLNPRIFSMYQQKTILDNVLKFLESDQYIKNNHVLIVGGELFDNINRKNILLDFFAQIAGKMFNNEIDLLYLNTNLIYSSDCLNMLMYVLDTFCGDNEGNDNVSSRVRLATSYDLDGRFKTENDKQRFFKNLSCLRYNYPQIKPVVNMILTKKFCESVLSGELNIIEFMEKHDCNVNIIPYIVLTDELTAERELIFKTLLYIYNQNPSFIIDWLQNIDLKQPRKMFYCDTNMKFTSCECGIANCGHSVNFKKYSTHNSCFVCDLKEVFNGCF